MADFKITLSEASKRIPLLDGRISTCAVMIKLAEGRVAAAERQLREEREALSLAKREWCSAKEAFEEAVAVVNAVKDGHISPHSCIYSTLTIKRA